MSNTFASSLRNAAQQPVLRLLPTYYAGSRNLTLDFDPSWLLLSILPYGQPGPITGPGDLRGVREHDNRKTTSHSAVLPPGKVSSLRQAS